MNKLKQAYTILITDKKIGYFLFWSWNLIFLAFMLLGFGPLVLPEVITAVQVGTIPAQFVFYGVVLALIPLLSMIVGATLLRRDPGRLFALGYGVEGPIMLILAIRFFVIRQLTPQLGFILIIALIGILTYLWQLLDRRLDQRAPAVGYGRVVGLTCLLLIGLYISLIVAFYAIPAGYAGIEGVADSIGRFFRNFGANWVVFWDNVRNFSWTAFWHEVDRSWRALLYIPFAIFGFTLFFYTATLFVLMPIAISVMYVRAWWRGVVALLQRQSRGRVAWAVTTVLLTVAVTLIVTDRQPQTAVFGLLETPPATMDDISTLIDDEAQIRSGLTNAYLGQYRYLSAEGDVFHIWDMYRHTLPISDDEAMRVQKMYERVARPLLYRPATETTVQPNNRGMANQALRDDAESAAKLYERYFDEPINEGEKAVVIDAVRTTWNAQQARAGWQAVDDREILLTRQEISVTEWGDWAEVELYEVYENQTAQRQEAIYYFTLPESAVLTGVWLGESDSRDDRFAFQVAPRGAAQQTYREQVARRVDPALLEQLGPSQYRLRIFPILPLEASWNDGTRRTVYEDAPPMHMWLTYDVMATSEGWPMPHLSRGYNVYWDQSTERVVNGRSLDDKPLDNNAWLPTTIAAAGDVTPTAHRVDFADGTSILATPLNAQQPLIVPSDLTAAVVLDRSRSMAPLDTAVQKTLATLQSWGVRTDLILTASEVYGEPPSVASLDGFELESIVYFGGQNAVDLLVQFADVADASAYDAIFVLTDGTGYGVGETDAAVSVPDAPVWMVHLNGRFPLGYDDSTLDALLASGGGTAGDIETAMTRFLVSRSNGSSKTWTDLIDGYRWERVPTASLESNLAHDPAFTAIAARRLIQAEQIANRGSITDLETLDQLHALAVENGIVTPYSSMIVLVNLEQQRRLDALSGQEDRFDREFEEVGETTPPPVVTGVPEPEEWLLIFAVVLMLLYWNREQLGRLRFG